MNKPLEQKPAVRIVEPVANIHITAPANDAAKAPMIEPKPVPKQNTQSVASQVTYQAKPRQQAKPAVATPAVAKIATVAPDTAAKGDDDLMSQSQKKQ